eukprot:gb/GECG01004725.1/.p1 GENE.gb/GECG01004725.1/~~gb/GECG01004725.1/.p1  ORF type:complete len:417 (+),score=35.02 gb/GECG01004725.1/:1-1251(+)
MSQRNRMRAVHRVYMQWFENHLVRTKWWRTTTERAFRRLDMINCNFDNAHHMELVRHLETVFESVLEGCPPGSINYMQQNGGSLLHALLLCPDRRRTISNAAEEVIIMSLCLNFGLLPDIRNEKGDTPVHVVMQLNNEARMKSCMRTLCMDLSAPLNQKNKIGDTPIHIACRKGQPVALRELVSYSKEQGTLDFNMDNNLGETPLSLALGAGKCFDDDRWRSVNVLLDSENTDCNAKDRNGNTPLHVAVSRRDGAKSARELSQIIKRLIKEKQADVNLKNASEMGGDTPIHLATERGYNQIVRELLESSSIDLSVKNNVGNTSIHIACVRKDLLTLRYLLEPLKRNTIESAVINSTNNIGETALHCAAKFGCSESFKALCQVSGICVDIPDERDEHYWCRSLGTACVRTGEHNGSQ